MLGGSAAGAVGASAPILNHMLNQDDLRDRAHRGVVDSIRGGDNSFAESLRTPLSEFAGSDPKAKSLIMNALERAGQVPKHGAGRIALILAAIGAPIAGMAAGGAAGNELGTRFRNNQFGTSLLDKLQSKRDKYEAYEKRVPASARR